MKSNLAASSLMLSAASFSGMLVGVDTDGGGVAKEISGAGGLAESRLGYLGVGISRP